MADGKTLHHSQVKSIFLGGKYCFETRQPIKKCHGWSHLPSSTVIRCPFLTLPTASIRMGDMKQEPLFLPKKYPQLKRPNSSCCHLQSKYDTFSVWYCPVIQLRVRPWVTEPSRAACRTTKLKLLDTREV